MNKHALDFWVNHEDSSFEIIPVVRNMGWEIAWRSSVRKHALEYALPHFPRKCTTHGKVYIRSRASV